MPNETIYRNPIAFTPTMALSADITRPLVNLSNSALSGGSPNGTFIGVNTEISADFINCQNYGSTKFKVDNGGNIYITSGVFYYFGNPSVNGSFRQGLSGGVLLTQYVSGGVWYNTNQILAQ